MGREPQIGDMATMKRPYLGYRRIELVQKYGFRWLARIESGLEIEVYEDEFVLDGD